MNTSTTGSVAPAHTPRHMYRLVIAASLGNALEWFDLLVYGYFAVTISKLFFPVADETVSLLLTLGTFGASYLVRPLGAIVLGGYADRAGRKASLVISIVLMLVGTFLTAIMPTYASIGIAAPIAMLLARLMQGFSVGESSAVPPRFWWSTVRSGRDTWRVSNGPARGWQRCWRPLSGWR